MLRNEAGADFEYFRTSFRSTHFIAAVRARARTATVHLRLTGDFEPTQEGRAA